MYYTYVIQSTQNGKYYIGSTNNIPKRLQRHNSGTVKATKSYIPYKLVYYEEYEQRSAAIKREYEIKRYKGGNAFKKLLNKI